MIDLNLLFDDDQIIAEVLSFWNENIPLKQRDMKKKKIHGNKRKIFNFLEQKILQNVKIAPFLGLFLIFVLEKSGFLPQAANASPIPPSQPSAVVLRQPSTVISAFQPRNNLRGLRKPLTVGPLSLQPPLFQTHKAALITTRRSISEIFGFSCRQYSTSNGIIRVVTRSSLKIEEILVTKEYNIPNPKFSPKQNIFVQQQVEDLIKTISSSDRLATVKKVLNFQGWKDVDGVPTLVFNADASRAVYAQNKKTCRVVEAILKNFIHKNLSLYTDAPLIEGETYPVFNISFNKSDAEHPNQKSQLESLLLTKKEGSTYLLESKVHREKTSEVDLVRPETVKTVSEWFHFNGQSTIACIQSLWEEDKLTESVESLSVFKDAILECIEEDINTFQKTGLPDNALNCAGQIHATITGQRDLERLAWTIVRNPKGNLMDISCKVAINRCLKKSLLRAVFIYDGLNQYPFDSLAHRAQDYQTEIYLNSLAKLVNVGIETFPELLKDEEFLKNFSTFTDVIQGKGEYEDIANGEIYANFQKSLANPKSHLNLFSRNLQLVKD